MNSAATAPYPNRRWRHYLLAWGLAAAVRFLYLALARPGFTSYYWDASTSLLIDGTLSSDGVRTALLEPLYPIFLATLRVRIARPSQMPVAAAPGTERIVTN